MKRYYVFKDGQQIGAAAERENALKLIRAYQAQEWRHYIRAEFSIICGEEEYIPYERS